MTETLTMTQVAVLLDAHRSLFTDSATALGISLDHAEKLLERFEQVELQDAALFARSPQP